MKMTHMTELETLQITSVEDAYTSNHNPTINNKKNEIRENGFRYRVFIMIDGVNDSECVHNAQCNRNLRFNTSSKSIPLVS